MKHLLILSLFILNTTNQTPKNDKIYLAHGLEHGINHLYGVSEIIIKSDFTFSWKTYNINKVNWKNYLNGKKIIHINGKVLKENDLYVLKEVGSNTKGQNEWIVNIKKEKIEFYIKENSKIIKTKTEYKRIKTIDK